MKWLLTTLLLLICLCGSAQQGNLCRLLIKSFNASDEGFAFLRPGTSADTIEDYTLDEDTVAAYGLKTGSIVQYKNLTSAKYSGKTFTAWSLFLSGQHQLLYDREWNDVKETVTAQLTAFAKQYAEGCFPQLQMSELVLPVKDYDMDLLTYYFYPKQITIPKGADKTQIEALLKESTYIEFSVRKPWLIRGYFIGYSVNGLHYNN